eukprot:351460-Chlamydomonas_euryale.AAC.1
MGVVVTWPLLPDALMQHLSVQPSGSCMLNWAFAIIIAEVLHDQQTIPAIFGSLGCGKQLGSQRRQLHMPTAHAHAGVSPTAAYGMPAAGGDTWCARAAYSQPPSQSAS